MAKPTEGFFRAQTASSAVLRDECAITRIIPDHDMSPKGCAIAWETRLDHPHRILSLAATRQLEFSWRSSIAFTW